MPRRRHGRESRKPGKRWRLIRIRWLALALAIWALADFGGSWLAQHTRLRRSLDYRLAAAFGRPVQVGAYSFSLFGGPALEASPVAVAEDPRFGHEYFLRADALTIRVHWAELLRGRFVLGALSVSRPSLNLVRADDGRWNIEEWLPSQSASHLSGVGRSPRIGRIEVNAGRINFKRGDEKLPFAFVNVAGWVEQDAPGRWLLNLDASPARAAVILQDAGTIHVQGRLGGTSSRLRPAELQLSWQNAALADVLRLGTGTDHGIRGTLSVALSADTHGPEWILQGRAELRRLHRWDLSARADNPAINLQVHGDWFPGVSTVAISELTLEGPRSRLDGAGEITWSSAGIMQRAHPTPYRTFRIRSSKIDFEDVLAWLRAFHPGVADDLMARGNLTMAGEIGGWPPRVLSASVQTNGADLEGGSLRVPIRFGKGALEISPNHARPAAIVITIGDANGSLRIESDSKRGTLVPAFNLAGHATRVEDITTTAAALGWPLPSGWRIEGPASLEMRWEASNLSAPLLPHGRIDFQGLTLTAPYLNQSITQIQGEVELTSKIRRLDIKSAQAFGGEWSGTVESNASGGRPSFVLVASRLNAEDLDRWLNPRWRQGLLASVLPFLSNVPTSYAQMNLQAGGRLNVEQFAFSRFVVKRLQGKLAIDGRRIELADATADFYGGRVKAGLVADLESLPVYQLKATVAGLNLGALEAGSSVFARTLGGAASGKIAFEMQGVGRTTLIGSLQCRGNAEIRNASLSGYDLVASVRTGTRRPGKSLFALVAGPFSCANHHILFPSLRLVGAGETLEAAGNVNFLRNQDVRISSLGSTSRASIEPGDGTSDVTEIHLTGPLLAPQISRVRTTLKP